jgi:peptide/nickel transport system permease protein
MTNYLIRRAFQMMIVVLLATLAIYVLLNVAPGGPLSGLKLAGADRKSRVSDADIARLEAYLGLDKPLAMRYVVWLVGDDWLGSDWMYLGLTQYKQPQLAKDGTPIVKYDTETNAPYYVYTKYRFWADPGVADLNPGEPLWVWGQAGSSGNYQAEKVQVKPATTAQVPADVAVAGTIVSQRGWNVFITDINGHKYTITTSKATQWEFPPGEALPRPTDGHWLNVSWLFGPGGLLGQYAGFHGDPQGTSTQGILRMDFGTSWKLARGQPVIDLMKSRLGNTLILMSTAVFLSLLVGIPIGIYSAVHQYSKTDYVVTTFAFFGSAMPVFWFGLMLILVFSYQFKQWNLPFMPSGGVALLREAPPGSLLSDLSVTPGSFVDRIVHIILPALMLSLLYMAGWSRYSRSSMLEVLRQDYVRTARAKGLLERVVIVKHALRNALIPVITILVFDIAGIFSGAILTETIFSYPGMGRLYFDALSQSDWPVVMAYLFITAVLVVMATLTRDIIYTIVDPRIRFS